MYDAEANDRRSRFLVPFCPPGLSCRRHLFTWWTEYSICVFMPSGIIFNLLCVAWSLGALVVTPSALFFSFLHQSNCLHTINKLSLQKTMTNYSIKQFPKSRIATIDIGAISKQKHYINALLECDVTLSREQLKALRSGGDKISFTAWLLKVISDTLIKHNDAAAFLIGKKKLITFEDISISLLVEKKLGDTKVPLPVVIEKINKKSLQQITKEIEAAKNEELSEQSIVLNRKTSFMERSYYYLPGYLRRIIWRSILRNPQYVYKKMGNAAFTSVGMFGQIKGWFIHTTIHPISFGAGSVIKKPVVINDEIKIREILNMTVLIDHDVIDGAPMVRFISDLVKSIESAGSIK